MIVYRFKFAYDRYYEAKTAIGELHCGLRNFNIGACAFLRDAARGRAGHDPDDVEGARRRAALLLRERTELLRLSGLLFGFLRQLLREQRLGYPNDRRPGDRQLLTQDARGSPSLGSLLRDADEVAAYARVPFQNRPNAVVTRMQTIVEHHRRLGHVCERGAFDLCRNLRPVLLALKNEMRRVRHPHSVPVHPDVQFRHLLLHLLRAVHIHGIVPVHLVFPQLSARHGFLRDQLRRRGDRAAFRLAGTEPRSPHGYRSSRVARVRANSPPVRGKGHRHARAPRERERRAVRDRRARRPRETRGVPAGSRSPSRTRRGTKRARSRALFLDAGHGEATDAARATFSFLTGLLPRLQRRRASSHDSTGHRGWRRRRRGDATRCHRPRAVYSL